MKTTFLTLLGAVVALMLAPAALAGAPNDEDSDSGKSTDTPSSSSDFMHGDPKIHHSATDMDYVQGDREPDIYDYNENWNPDGIKVRQESESEMERWSGQRDGETGAARRKA